MREKVRVAKVEYYKDPENLEKLRAMARKYHDSEVPKINGMSGRKHSEETRRKMSDARTGKIFGPLSEEHKAKLRRPRSDETKEKMRSAWVVRRTAKHGEVLCQSVLCSGV